MFKRIVSLTPHQRGPEGMTMNATTSATIATKTEKANTTPENWSDEHGLWLSCIVAAYLADYRKAPIVGADIDGRDLDEARKLYTDVDLDRDRDDVLAELASMGYLAAHTIERGHQYEGENAYTPTEKALAEFGPAENFKAEHGVILQTMAEWPHDALSREDMESGAFVAAVDGNAQQWHVWPKAASFPRLVAELTRWRYLALTRAKVNTWSLTEKGRAELKAWKAPKAAS